MNKEKISSQEIVDLLATKLSVSKRIAEDFLKNMFSTIEESLLEGEPVKVKNFGTFKLQWNEPRKSVNVNTGEEIILPGFNKVIFTPETSLKNIVNEPFAHLEPLVLDDIQEKQHSHDPLKILNDQAIEIKNILSEINSTANKVEPVAVTTSLVSEIGDEVEEVEQFEDENPQSEIEPSIVINQEAETSANPELTNGSVEEVGNLKENEVSVNAETTNSSSGVIDNKIQEEKQEENKIVEILKSKVETDETASQNFFKRRKKLWLFIIFLSVIGGGAILYFYNLTFHSWVNRNVLSITVKTKNWTGKNVTPTAPFGQNLSDSIVRDSSNTKEVVDPYIIMFENARKYEELITIDRARTTISLTSLSERFYGHKDFWVYIYDANIENIQDPENIKVGTLIKIPKIDERLIDVNNPRSFQMAQRLNYLLLKKSSQPVDTVYKEVENVQNEVLSRTNNQIPKLSTTYIDSVYFKSGDRLTILAKRYYGHKDFWIYIYEANKANIKNPDVVPVGLKIRIPKMNPALIDANNPACIKKAQAMYDAYLKQIK